MTDPDYKALCAELVELSAPTDSIPQLAERLTKLSELSSRARAALEAQPKPVAPTESDVTELFYRHMGEGSEVGFENAIAEALARWGRSTPQPVAVSERLPGPENKTTDDECWFWDPISGCWFLLPGSPLNDHYTHWLPHWALPVPAGEGAS
jgi:hypothetical protein